MAGYHEELFIEHIALLLGGVDVSQVLLVVTVCLRS